MNKLITNRKMITNDDLSKFCEHLEQLNRYVSGRITAEHIFLELSKFLRRKGVEIQ